MCSSYIVLTCFLYVGKSRVSHTVLFFCLKQIKLEIGGKEAELIYLQFLGRIARLAFPTPVRRGHY